MACPAQAVKTGFNAINCLHWASCSIASMRGKVPSARAGTILDVSPEGIDVACGEGAFRILEVQPAGKTRMSVAEWIRGEGRRLLPGQILGEPIA